MDSAAARAWWRRWFTGVTGWQFSSSLKSPRVKSMRALSVVRPSLLHTFVAAAGRAAILTGSSLFSGRGTPARFQHQQQQHLHQHQPLPHPHPAGIHGQQQQQEHQQASQQSLVKPYGLIRAAALSAVAGAREEHAGRKKPGGANSVKRRPQQQQQQQQRRRGLAFVSPSSLFSTSSSAVSSSSSMATSVMYCTSRTPPCAGGQQQHGCGSSRRRFSTGTGFDRIRSSSTTTTTSSSGSHMGMKNGGSRGYGRRGVGGSSLKAHLSSVSQADPPVGGMDGRRVSSYGKYRLPPTEVPMPNRLVVFGDIHGDRDALQKCLKMSNLIDESDNWAGGDAVLVQCGDIFDRGDRDLDIEEWLYVLALQAEKAGGSVHTLLGNHEVMNALGDHSMATHDAFPPFEQLRPELDSTFGDKWYEEKLGGYEDWMKCRVAAMNPRGPVGKLLSGHSAVLKVGPNLLVHAGLLPDHLDEHSMEEMNTMAWEWLVGLTRPPEILLGGESLVWSRVYSTPDSRDLGVEHRSQLVEVLKRTGCERMIVGHTPQRLGINSAADGLVWRVDTGMTAMMGGPPEALEIVGDEVTVITETGRLAAKERKCTPYSDAGITPQAAADDQQP